eukprot:Sspe_Gene.95802::Locus_68107_Transcript_1_1_Confidence_1.000_Length_3733::g.95802::m.95802
MPTSSLSLGWSLTWCGGRAPLRRCGRGAHRASARLASRPPRTLRSPSPPATPPPPRRGKSMETFLRDFKDTLDAPRKAPSPEQSPRGKGKSPFRCFSPSKTLRELVRDLRSGCLVTLHGIELDDEQRHELLAMLLRISLRNEAFRNATQQGPDSSPPTSNQSPRQTDTADLEQSPSLAPSMLPRARSTVVFDEEEPPSAKILLFINLRMQRILSSVRRKLAERRREARLVECEAEWGRRVLRQAAHRWRVECRWRRWLRRRRMRGCWDSWQVFLSKVAEWRSSMILRLDSMLTKFRAHKVLVVWSRYTSVVKSTTTLPADFFAGQLTVPQWDAWFASYCNQLALAKKVSNFRTKHMLSRCLQAFKEHTGTARYKRRLARLAVQFRREAEMRILAHSLGHLWRSGSSAIAARQYSQSMTKRVWRCWKARFAQRVAVRCCYLRLRRTLVNRRTASAYTRWKVQWQAAVFVRLVGTIRSMENRPRLLLCIYALKEDTVHFQLCTCFARWARLAKMRRTFCYFASNVLTLDRRSLLQTAFDLWKGLPGDWATRRGEHSTMPWGKVGEVVGRIQKTFPPHKLSLTTDYLSEILPFLQTTNRDGDTPLPPEFSRPVLLAVLRYLAAHTIVAKSVRLQELAIKVSHRSMKTQGLFTVARAATALRSTPSTDRQASLAEQIEAREADAKERRRKGRSHGLQAARAYIEKLGPRFYDYTSSSFNITSLLWWIDSRLRENRRLVLYQEQRDSVTEHLVQASLTAGRLAGRPMRNAPCILCDGTRGLYLRARAVARIRYYIFHFRLSRKALFNRTGLQLALNQSLPEPFAVPHEKYMAGGLQHLLTMGVAPFAVLAKIRSILLLYARTLPLHVLGDVKAMGYGFQRVVPLLLTPPYDSPEFEGVADPSSLAAVLHAVLPPDPGGPSDGGEGSPPLESPASSPSFPRAQTTDSIMSEFKDPEGAPPKPTDEHSLSQGALLRYRLSSQCLSPHTPSASSRQSLSNTMFLNPLSLSDISSPAPAVGASRRRRPSVRWLTDGEADEGDPPPPI